MHSLSYLPPKTTIKKSPIHKWGLFVIKPIKKGEIVLVKGGHIYESEVRKEVEKKLGPVYCQIADNLSIGPFMKGEVKRSEFMVNHSCNPNAGPQGQIVFVAMRDIKTGEEITIDYATTDDEDYRMKCHCGAKNCRKVITGKDWQRKGLQKKYGKYFSWYLLEKIKKKS